MPNKILQVVRIAVVLVSLGLIVFLLQRGGVPTQVRIVVIAALGYYVVRLWVLGSRVRRDRARRGTDAGSLAEVPKAESSPPAEVSKAEPPKAEPDRLAEVSKAEPSREDGSKADPD